MTALPTTENSLSNNGKEMRVPPHSFEAEKALLGAILHNNKAHEAVSEFLQAAHFADPLHAQIYQAITKIIERGQIADPVTLKDYFERNDALQEMGGVDYLSELAGSVISIINVKDYGQLIYNFHLRRQLINLGEEVVNNAFDNDLDFTATQQIEHAEQTLFDLAASGDGEKSFVGFGDALAQAINTAVNAYQSDSKIVGLTSGLRDLDQKLGGLHPSDLIILAGRPSMGKTAIATNIAFNAAHALLKGDPAGGGVAFFSLEMSAEQLANRLLSQESGVSSDKIRRGMLTDEDFPKFTEVARTLSNLKLFIDDTAGLTVSGLRTRARRLKRKEDIKLIVVDYLQLLSPAPGRDKSGNRVQEISDISRSLKTIAKELSVPVIALSQLSREVEKRDDKKPQLSDLRESGSIEQDADVVIFMYRPEYYLSRKKPAEEDSDKLKQWQMQMDRERNLSEIIIAKQRHGPIGSVFVHFSPEHTKFVDVALDTLEMVS